MIFAPVALSGKTLDREQLAADKKEALRFGQCALGKRALYLGGYLLCNTHYVPLNKVKRVYKRLAVSKGFYEGKVFATLAYLVVVYDGGKERTCRFQHEEDLDLMLSAFRKHTSIPVGKA